MTKFEAGDLVMMKRGVTLSLDRKLERSDMGVVASHSYAVSNSGSTPCKTRVGLVYIDNDDIEESPCTFVPVEKLQADWPEAAEASGEFVDQEGSFFYTDPNGELFSTVVIPGDSNHVEFMWAGGRWDETGER